MFGDGTAQHVEAAASLPLLDGDVPCCVLSHVSVKFGALICYRQMSISVSSMCICFLDF